MNITRQHITARQPSPVSPVHVPLSQVDAGVNTYVHKHVSTPLTNITRPVTDPSMRRGDLDSKVLLVLKLQADILPTGYESTISPPQLKRTAPKRTLTEALAISPGMALL